MPVAYNLILAAAAALIMMMMITFVLVHILRLLAYWLHDMQSTLTIQRA